MSLLHGPGADPWARPLPDPPRFVRWTDPLEIFRALQEHEPVARYLEVGSWLGGSALRAAEAFPTAEIVCVDAWLGSAEHWGQPEEESHDLCRCPATGDPGIYAHFLANVAAHRARLVPLRLPSLTAAQLLRHHAIAADVIYLDAGHSREEVLLDCAHWWPRATRWLLGDDWGDPRFGVADGVLDFMRQARIPGRALQVIGGNFWLISRAAIDTAPTA
jgi:hypothetical protein